MDPRPTPTTRAPQHVCQVFAGGVVKIDGKYSVWREDLCGSLSRASKAAACEPNNDLKLWRLYWNSTFWIYLKMKSHSASVTALCPRRRRGGRQDRRHLELHAAARG